MCLKVQSSKNQQSIERSFIRNEPLLCEWQKRFQQLKPEYVALQILIAGNQSADWNRLAAIEPIARIISCCKSNELAAMCQFALSANSEILLLLQITELISRRKCRKIISYECEWAFCYQFFAAKARVYWQATYFHLSYWNQFFLRFKEQVHFTFQNWISAVQI